METPSNHPTSGVMGYLRAHPIALLLLLTPGIPQYLSTSSPLSNIILNPVFFPIQLALNLGLYGPGVLLIREAVLRWKKGLATVIFLGAAYAIFEEGFALRTMFTSSTGQPVGDLAVYGRWMGINWVWSAGLLIVHIVFSISLPIMLFGLTFPDLKSRSLVSSRQIVALFAIFLVDALILRRVVGYTPAPGIELLTILVMLGLALTAWRVPVKLLSTGNFQPGRSLRFFAVLGFIVLPFEILIGAIGDVAKFPPSGTIAVEAIIALSLIFLLLRSLGTLENERQKLALAIGLITSIALFGLLASLTFPVVILADLWMGLYLRGLWRKYGARVYVEGPQLPSPKSTLG
jgi:hypothetical protein